MRCGRLEAANFAAFIVTDEMRNHLFKEPNLG
jgi:hypothetical protein